MALSIHISGLTARIPHSEIDLVLLDTSGTSYLIYVFGGQRAYHDLFLQYFNPLVYNIPLNLPDILFARHLNIL